MLYVDVSTTGLYQNDEFTQNYSHMISFTIFTVNGVQNISPIVMPVTITILREYWTHGIALPERNAVRSIFAQYRYCDWHNNRRDVLDAIDCEYSERNHVTVILCKFVVLIKACGRNVNIEHNKRILIVIPFGILGLI